MLSRYSNVRMETKRPLSAKSRRETFVFGLSGRWLLVLRVVPRFTALPP